MAHMYIHHISVTIHFSFLHIFHSSWQAESPLPFPSATTLPRHFWMHNFSGRSGPHGRSCWQNQKLSTPSGYQTASMFSWHGRLLPMLSAKLRTSFKTFDPNAELFWPLMSPILISEGSCSKNKGTIGGHLDSFPANWQTQNHIIQLLIVNYLLSLYRQESNLAISSSPVTKNNVYI
jgi:hypothetical protein